MEDEQWGNGRRPGYRTRSEVIERGKRSLVTVWARCSSDGCGRDEGEKREGRERAAPVRVLLALADSDESKFS